MSREELREAYGAWLLRQLATPQAEDLEVLVFDEFIAPLVEALDCIDGGHPCDQSHREDAFLALSEFYRKLDIKRFL